MMLSVSSRDGVTEATNHLSFLFCLATASMPESDALRCHNNYGFVVADNSISSYYPGHNIFKYKVVLGFYIQSVCLEGM